MINKSFLIFLISFQFSYFLGQNNNSRWNNEDYAIHNYKSFQKLDIIHQEINRDNVDFNLLNAAIFYATNIQRSNYKRNAFIHSKSLEKAAQNHSEDMVKFNFYSHTSKIKGKKTMSNRLNNVGIVNAYMAENIFDFFLINPTYWTMAIGLVDGWMKSKGHKANILNKDLIYLGCGSKYYLNKQWPDYFYVKSTQNFSSKSGSL